MIQSAVPVPPQRSRRAAWIRQVTLWHWISSGITLGGMLLFTLTGITLNHASEIPATPRTATLERTAPPDVLAALNPAPPPTDGRHPLPANVASWLKTEFGTAGEGSGEWSAGEVYVSLPRPGGDSWVTIDRQSGAANYERTDRGWIAYANDLHKGRHTGLAWALYIDILAAACLIFTISGLILLQTHAAKRPSTWPIITVSVLAPFLILLFFVH